MSLYRAANYPKKLIIGVALRSWKFPTKLWTTCASARSVAIALFRFLEAYWTQKWASSSMPPKERSCASRSIPKYHTLTHQYTWRTRSG